jgi:hypothetical protein
MGADSTGAPLPFETRAVIWMSSVSQEGTSSWVKASGIVT